jgi:hypothetical protein
MRHEEIIKFLHTRERVLREVRDVSNQRKFIVYRISKETDSSYAYIKTCMSKPHNSIFFSAKETFWIEKRKCIDISFLFLFKFVFSKSPS